MSSALQLLQWSHSFSLDMVGPKESKKQPLVKALLCTSRVDIRDTDWNLEEEIDLSKPLKLHKVHF